MDQVLTILFFVGLLIYGWKTGFSDGRDED